MITLHAGEYLGYSNKIIKLKVYLKVERYNWHNPRSLENLHNPSFSYGLFYPVPARRHWNRFLVGWDLYREPPLFILRFLHFMWWYISAVTSALLADHADSSPWCQTWRRLLRSWFQNTHYCLTCYSTGCRSSALSSLIMRCLVCQFLQDTVAEWSPDLWEASVISDQVLIESLPPSHTGCYPREKA